ncbi:MAG: fibronectin type III domain-containing protein [Nocardioides sp.]|nr:fibronectin type III domain-containing protein [Nocardioides sp.]
MKQPGHQRRRALSCLLAVALTPVTVATFPTASAEEPGPPAERTRIAPAEPLLDGPARGRKAIRQLGDQLRTAAARNDLRPAELRSLLRTDDSVWVDPQGSVYYVDPVHEESHATAESAATTLVAPLADTFALHSNPGASRTILLDFDGAHVSGSWWNAVDMGVLPGTHPAWDPAGDGPLFSAGERLMVQQIWAMVAEDFAPFDVDVTTEDPGEAGMVRSSSSDTVYGTRVLITPSDDPFATICDRACGGVAYLDVFDLVGGQHQPAWVFPQALGNDPKNIAEAATHEAGHNLGLSHDGTASQSYYAGHGIWAPIMGLGYDRPLVQWSAGAYPDADNQEDDLEILTGYLDGRPDEASDSVTTPSPLPEGEAYIGTREDVDAYLLGSCTAGSMVEVSPAAVAPNLDVRATLHDADGTQRAVAAPPSGLGDGITASGLGASLTVPTDGDQWVVRVEGAGDGTWATQGYDDYASLGAYTISAPGCDGEVAEGVPSAPGDVAAGSAQTDALTLSWSAPATEGGTPVTAYVVTRSGSADSVTLPSEARSHTFTGLTAGTTYQLSVRAVNATGAGPTVTVSATTSAPPAAAPSAPRNVTGSYDPALDTLNAWWTEPASTGTQPITGYAIYLNGSYLGQLGSTDRGVVISQGGAFAEGTYVVGIAAVNAVGFSPISTVTITVETPDRPSNDAVAAAQVLTGTSGSVAGDNTYATRESIDPVPPSPYDAGGYSVWYSWTPSSAGAVQMQTSGGGVGRDTTLAAYTGQPGALVEVAGNDDSNGYHAAISFAARAGTRYLVVVDGFDGPGGSGPFTLTWAQQPAALAPTKMKPPKVVVRGKRAIVRWQAAQPNGSRITRYLVDISRGKDKSLKPTARKTVFKLKPGRYRVRVAARNAVGRSPYSRWVRLRIR